MAAIPPQARIAGLLPDEPIDVAGWQPDEEFARYPEGARPKRALFPPPTLALPFVRPTRRYLFKASARRYPEQFWAEIVAYHVGCLLGVAVPPAFAAWDSTRGDCGALIEWFYEDDKAVFMMGGHFMQRAIDDYDRDKGKQHNFQTVRALWRAFHSRGLTNADWIDRWGDTFLFDALIGNTDRHQDNWGCLFERPAGRAMELSPCYDNGTSLGHERFTDRVAVWKPDDFRRYVDRGTHHMKWHRDDNSGCGHFELVRRVVELYPDQRERLLAMMQNFDVDSLARTLQHLVNYSLPVPLTAQRANFMLELVRLRALRLIDTLT